MMIPNKALLQNPYLQDILDQPRAIRDTVASLAASRELNNFAKSLTPASYPSIVLTGMGGSFHILNPLYLKLVELGFPAVMAETSELIHSMPRLLDKRGLLVVVSQSGRSAEIVRLLEMVGEGATILGVTNDYASPLARKSEVVALIKAGAEASVACKTTTASLAALAWLGHCVSGTDQSSMEEQLEQAAVHIERYLVSLNHHVESLKAELSGIHHLFVTGRGSSLAAVGVGGMMMKEAAHFHSEGLSSAAFRHGPFEMLGNDCFVLVFAGDESVVSLHRKLVEDVCQTQAGAALIGMNPKLPPFQLPASKNEIRPILELLPLQMASLALALNRGREPGKFENIGKVTTSE